MNLKKYFCGNETERMPNIAFRMMSLFLEIRDFFCSFEERVDKFGIKKGFTVVDYGCGPGRYIKKVSQLVGANGKVYAADIHELAINTVREKIDKYNLKNVEPVLTNGYSCNIADHTADVIYALDMFHMIKDPVPFLKELHRLLKKDGFLIIDDGHQPRNKAKTKINNSKVWNITKESKDHLRCTPIWQEEFEE